MLILDAKEQRLALFASNDSQIKFQTIEKNSNRFSDFISSAANIKQIGVVMQGGGFSDVRAATVTANILSFFKQIPVISLAPEELTPQMLKKKLQETPLIKSIQAVYSSGPSISRQ